MFTSCIYIKAIMVDSVTYGCTYKFKIIIIKFITLATNVLYFFIVPCVSMGMFCFLGDDLVAMRVTGGDDISIGEAVGCDCLKGDFTGDFVSVLICKNTHKYFCSLTVFSVHTLMQTVSI